MARCLSVLHISGKTDDVSDATMRDKMGRSSSINSLTSQAGGGSTLHDLGGASMMIFLIPSVDGKENEDSTEVKQLVGSIYPLFYESWQKTNSKYC